MPYRGPSVSTPQNVDSSTNFRVDVSNGVGKGGRVISPSKVMTRGGGARVGVLVLS